MGIDTRVYLPAGIEFNRLQEAVEAYPLATEFETKVKDWRTGRLKKVMVKSEIQQSNIGDPSYFTFVFKLGEDFRSAWCQAGSTCALGPCFYMKLGGNDKGQAYELFKYLARIFGGFVMKNDCDGAIEEIVATNTGNGLAYYLELATARGLVNGEMPAAEAAAKVLAFKDQRQKEYEEMKAKRRI